MMTWEQSNGGIFGGNEFTRSGSATTFGEQAKLGKLDSIKV